MSELHKAQTLAIPNLISKDGILFCLNRIRKSASVIEIQHSTNNRQDSGTQLSNSDGIKIGIRSYHINVAEEMEDVGRA